MVHHEGCKVCYGLSHNQLLSYQAMNNELSQFFNFPIIYVVVFGWNVDYRATMHIPMAKNPCFVQT